MNTESLAGLGLSTGDGMLNRKGDFLDRSELDSLSPNRMSSLKNRVKKGLNAAETQNYVSW